MTARTIQFIFLERRFEGSVLNTYAMTDIPHLTAILLSNFVTVRISTM